MEKIQLEAKMRDGSGKGVARALRREKRIPAVIYGGNEAPVMISIEGRLLIKALNKGGFFTQLCELDVDGKEHLVLARDVQLDPVLDLPIHADFMRVTERTRIKVNVPVVFINQEKSVGLSRGGLLNVVHHSIEVFCRATNIPEHLEVDIEGTEMGDAISFSAIKLPDGVTSTLPEDETIATISAPAAVRSAGEEGDEGAEGEESSEAEGENAEKSEEGGSE